MPWGVLAARHKSVAFSKAAKRAAVERKKAALTEHERHRAEREYAACPAPFGREQALARLAALGERVTQGELETLLRDAGHDEEVGTVVTMERWLRVLTALKLRFLETTAQPDGDQVEAFASLGGCRDKTGHIAAAKLKAVFEDFSLGIDIDRLMDEMDEEKDGLVSYHEFAQLLRAATSAPRHSALGASGHPPHHWRARGVGRPLTPEASSLLHPAAATGGDEEAACGASVSLRFPPGSGAIDDVAAAAAVGVIGGGLAGSDDDATDESVNSEEAAAAEAAAAEAAAAAAAAAAEEEQVEVVVTSAALLQSLEEITQKQEKGQRQALRAVTKWVQTLTHEISSTGGSPSSPRGGGGGGGGCGSANRTAARQYANHYAVPITRERAAAAPCIQQLPRRRCQEAATVRQRSQNDAEPTPAVFCRLTERPSVGCLRRTMRERVREKKAAGGKATSVCVALDRNSFTRDAVSEAWAAEPSATRRRTPQLRPQPRAAEAPVLVSSFSATRSGRVTPRPATAQPTRSATFACGPPLGLTTSAVSYATTAGASAASSRGGGGGGGGSGGNPLFLATETRGGSGGATLGKRRSGGAHGRARRRLAEEVRRAQDFTHRVRRDVSGGNGPPCFYKAGVVGSPRLADYDAAIAQMYDTQVKGVAVAASARVAAAAAALCVAFEAERGKQERLAHVAEVASVFSAACG